MKKALTVFILLFINKAFSQILNINENGQINSLGYVYPITFNHGLCQFAFIVNVNGNLTDYRFNHQECGSPMRVAIDDYVYDLPIGFELKYFENSWSIVQSINFGLCNRESGGPITSAGGKLANLSSLIFRVSDGLTVDYIASNATPYFRFRSFDGDIKCENSMPLSQFDSIFINGFE